MMRVIVKNIGLYLIFTITSLFSCEKCFEDIRYNYSNIIQMLDNESYSKKDTEEVWFLIGMQKGYRDCMQTMLNNHNFGSPDFSLSSVKTSRSIPLRPA